jgi:hypothetical protein
MMFKVQLPIQIFKQGKRFVAYTPLLDLSTSGRTENEVKVRFNEIIHIFFEELAEAGTLDEVMKNLGWQKIKARWQPPQVVANEEMSVSIPMMA